MSKVKICSLSQVKQMCSSQPRKKKVVFMSGAFDLFHFGHFKALKRAAAMGDTLIVQVDGNRLVGQRKSPDRPYLDESIRALMISSLEFVSCVFISNTPSEDAIILETIRPDIFVRAVLPQESAADRVRRTRELKKNIPRTRIVWMPQTPEVSTTKILPAVRENNGAPQPLRSL